MNESGIRPLEFKVLVKPEEVKEKTEGGLFIPDSMKDKEKVSSRKGTLIAVGWLAFTEPDWGEKPKVGDVVVHDKFAGNLVEGEDGKAYKLMNDKEICGVVYGNQ